MASSSSGVDDRLFEKLSSIHHRFIRTKLNESTVKAQFSSCKHTRLPGVFALDASENLRNCELYQSGQVHGIDISSAACVFALGIRPGEDILDLCAAPGAKTSFIAEMNETGTVTACDISFSRLCAMRSVVRAPQTSSMHSFVPRSLRRAKSRMSDCFLAIREDSVFQLHE